jgi:TPR repeat protein
MTPSDSNVNHYTLLFNKSAPPKNWQYRRESIGHPAHNQRGCYVFNYHALGRAISLSRWFGRPSVPDLQASTEVPVAERGDAESQYEQGQRFEKGEGVSQDDARAATYYLTAAVHGHAAAQFNLGLMYGRGRGVTRDGASAREWLRQAAEQGHPGAQYHLGVHLYQGSKRLPQAQVSEARIEGFKYVQLAVRQRYRGADSALEFIALGITRQEVQEGGRRAAAWGEIPARPVELPPNLPAS